MPNYVQRLVRNGNSTMVTIPQPLLRALGMVPGGTVVLRLEEDGSLRVRKLDLAGATVVGQRVTVDDDAAVQP